MDGSTSRFGVQENGLVKWGLIVLFGVLLSGVLLYPNFGVLGVVGLIGLILSISALHFTTRVPYVGKLLAIIFFVLLVLLVIYADMNGWFIILQTMFERLG